MNIVYVNFVYLIRFYPYHRHGFLEMKKQSDAAKWQFVYHK